MTLLSLSLPDLYTLINPSDYLQYLSSIVGHIYTRVALAFPHCHALRTSITLIVLITRISIHLVIAAPLLKRTCIKASYGKLNTLCVVHINIYACVVLVIPDYYAFRTRIVFLVLICAIQNSTHLTITAPF